MSVTYHDVQQRLSDIDRELLTKQPNLEHEAESYFKSKRDYERHYAEQYLKTTGTVEERRNKTILALWQSDAYKKLVAAEAAWEGLKAVTRTLETRASIGQSLLKAMQKEIGA